MPVVVRGTRTETAEFFANFRAWPKKWAPNEVTEKQMREVHVAVKKPEPRRDVSP